MLKSFETLRRFRARVYQMFDGSRDAVFEIIDGIASSPYARSAVEVSESHLVMRKFSSVYKGLERTRIREEALRELLVETCDQNGTLMVSGYAIQALDHTAHPRIGAKTVADRGSVRDGRGNIVGHQYSLLGRVMHAAGAWVGVEDCERIPTSKTPVQVGCEQIARLRATSKLKHIITADTEYLSQEMLDQASESTQLLIRLRGNRIMFHKCANERRVGMYGRPPLHGRKVRLADARTLGKPTVHVDVLDQDGERVEIDVYGGLHFLTRPRCSGSLIRVRVFRKDGTPKFPRPIWLFWSGPDDVDWTTFWRIYLRRFCIESVHQFAKNSLAWTSHRLGYTEREERWSWLVMLGYWQLLLAAPEAPDVYRPWEKPMPAGRVLTPARVQRAYPGIIASIGTPACIPKPRGKSPGRPRGFHPTPRLRYSVIIKAHNTT